MNGKHLINASDLDGARPQGIAWHRELLSQMTLAIAELRPAVISQSTRNALTDYLEFRHVVRNVYTFNLKGERVVGLLRALPAVFMKTRDELLEFADFLREIASESPRPPSES